MKRFVRSAPRSLSAQPPSDVPPRYGGHCRSFRPVKPARQSASRSKYPLNIQTASSFPGMYSWIMTLVMSAPSTAARRARSLRTIVFTLPPGSRGSMPFTMIGSGTVSSSRGTSSSDRGQAVRAVGVPLHKWRRPEPPAVPGCARHPAPPAGRPAQGPAWMRRCVGREAGSSIVQFPYLWGFQSGIGHFRSDFLESFEAVSSRRRSFSSDSTSVVGRQFPLREGKGESMARQDGSRGKVGRRAFLPDVGRTAVALAAGAIGLPSLLTASRTEAAGSRGAISQAIPVGQGAAEEPSAGNWKTWVLRSGSDSRLPDPAPPNRPPAVRELAQLKQAHLERTQAQIDAARFWDAGPATRRWPEMQLDMIKTHRPNPPRA